MSDNVGSQRNLKRSNDDGHVDSEMNAQGKNEKKIKK